MDGHPERVVVGVSGTPTSLQALRTATRVALRQERPLLAVLAWAPVGGETAYRRSPCPDLLGLWQESAVVRLRTSFEEALGGVPAGLAVESRVVRGEPGQVLVTLADHPDDLLVVGAGDRDWPACWWHGRVARYCLGHARCPVLAVPPPALLRELPRRDRHVPTVLPWPPGPHPRQGSHR